MSKKISIKRFFGAFIAVTLVMIPTMTCAYTFYPQAGTTPGFGMGGYGFGDYFTPGDYGNIGDYIPGADFTLPGADFTLPGVDIPVPGVDYPVPDVDYPVPGVDYPVPGVEVTVPDVEVTVPSVDSPVPGADSTVPGLDVAFPGLGFTPPTVNSAPTGDNVFQGFMDIFEQIINLEILKGNTDVTQYMEALNGLGALLDGLNTDLPIDDFRIQILELLTGVRDNGQNSDMITILINLIINDVLAASPQDTVDDLLNSIKESLGNVISGDISLESLKPDVVVDDMIATTAGKLAGDKYKVKLTGKIFFADVDTNGKPKSDKWVVLVHGFMMNGQAIADSLGQMYLDNGINVLAPDLRGFGDSEGSVAMGYLESLDVWDWLTYLNKKYDSKEIFIHGVSLGGATTVFISGLEVDGKTMENQNVIGLIEDCGYASMTGIITDMISMGTDEGLLSTLLGDLIKSLVMDLVGVGLTDENYDTLSNALNSLSNSTLPLLIVHGTGDTTVPASNSDKIYATAMDNNKIPYVQKYIADGQPHAFITLGMNKGEYKAHLEHFIEMAEKVEKGQKVEKVSTFVPGDVEETSVISTVVGAIKLLKNILFN